MHSALFRISQTFGLSSGVVSKLTDAFCEPPPLSWINAVAACTPAVGTETWPTSGCPRSGRAAGR